MSTFKEKWKSAVQDNVLEKQLELYEEWPSRIRGYLEDEYDDLLKELIKFRAQAKSWEKKYQELEKQGNDESCPYCECNTCFECGGHVSEHEDQDSFCNFCEKTYCGVCRELNYCEECVQAYCSEYCSQQHTEVCQEESSYSYEEDESDRSKGSDEDSYSSED